MECVSFDVRKGETLGIIGRNGSGKSTLLQLIAGTLHPTSGSVEIDGRMAALLELGAGFHPEFTGRENVFLNAALLGLSQQDVDMQLDDILAFADIGIAIDQPVKTYSSGMIVRLAFAVIVHVKADILIIDEALAVGDAFFVQKCMRFLRTFMEHGTVLFVSHDSAAVLLRDGEIVAAAQEERFTRRKNDESFPMQAIRYCLEEGKITQGELDAVIFYEKPILKFSRALETFLSIAPRGFRSFVGSVPGWLAEKLNMRGTI